MNKPTEKEQLYKNKVIDNRQVTMQFALNDLLNQPIIDRMDTAVGYFYISGLLQLKESFTSFMERQGKLRILMGNETSRLTLNTIDTAYTIAESVDDDLRTTLRKSFTNDLHKLDEQDQDFLLKFLDWIDQGKIIVKVYLGEGNYFHAKSYLLYASGNEHKGDSLVGSSNFSINGLTGNTELNVFSQDIFPALNQWFQEVWSDPNAYTFSKELIKAVNNVYPQIQSFKRYKPVTETYYDFANIFAKPYSTLDESTIWEGLYEHQRSGILKISDKVEQFNTSILADGVGLGKTRTAAGILKLAMKNNPQLKVLIIADKKLHDQWQQDMEAVNVDYSDFKFINRETFALMDAMQLGDLAENYQYVIIDEGHQGFKNRNTVAYRHAEYLFDKAKGRLKGLILTATPWNNAREDVINMGALFLDSEKIPLDRSYRQYFLFGNRGKAIAKLAGDDKAFSEFWEDIFLQRTRKTYGGQSVRYATRKFPAIVVPFEPAKERIFSENFERIDNLTFPYIDALRFFDKEKDSSFMMISQFKLMLLKRADSSWIAFHNSLNAIANNIDQTLRELHAIENSKSVTQDLQAYLRKTYKLDLKSAKPASIFEDAETDNFSVISNFQASSDKSKKSYVKQKEEQIKAIHKSQASIGIEQMKACATKDKEILLEIMKELQENFSRKDEKYETIRESVLSERAKGNKIILVSQFRDTALYIFENLIKEKNVCPESMGLVTGQPSDCKIGNVRLSKKEILTRFAPIAKNEPHIKGTEQETNILIGTDTISTGQNLQDATVLMNIDLPYNPMLLEQRIGRIDRPRDDLSVKQISIYTFPTYQAIESILKMTSRIAQKMKGIYQDTQFDDFVLPEYEEFLKKMNEEKNNHSASQAMEDMVKATEKKNQFNPGMSSIQHSTAYDESNKRLYEYLKSGINRSKVDLYEQISFSDDRAHTVLVIKLIYKDANYSEIKTETHIVHPESILNHDLVEAERKLKEAIPHTISSTKALNDVSAEQLIRNLKSLLHKIKIAYVDKYNAENAKQVESYKSIADKTAKKASANIQSSIRDKNKQSFIRSVITKEGLKGTDVIKLAQNLEFITKDSELYEYVENIANNIDEFWQNFSFYAKEFNLENIQLVNGRFQVTKPKAIIAIAEKSSVELILGNISIQDKFEVNCNYFGNS